MIVGFIRRLASLALLVVGAWWLYLYGVSDINSQSLWGKEVTPFLQYQDDPERLSSDALVTQSQSLAEESPELSESLAIAAFRQNPSSGRAATHLLRLYEAQGRGGDADRMADLASQLWPAHSYTRSNLAAYWLRRKRPDKLLQEWNVLLMRKGGLGKELYPIMLKMIENDKVAPLFLPFVQNPPKWWDSFFAYLSRHLGFARFEQLHRLRVASSDSLSKSEKNSYIDRLIKERRWEDAHDAWFLGLTPRQMRYGGLVYDGGFEIGGSHEGFGWQLSRSKNPKIKRDITYGIKGRKALQVTLRKQIPIDFKHVWQRVLLPAGSYELTMRYRTDTLTTTEGLSWRVRCIEGGTDVLAESDPLRGSNPWSNLKVNFTVPKSCSVQMLRLEAVSAFRHDWYFQGNVWFDEIKINAVEPQGSAQ